MNQETWKGEKMFLEVTSLNTKTVGTEIVLYYTTYDKSLAFCEWLSLFSLPTHVIPPVYSLTHPSRVNLEASHSTDEGSCFSPAPAKPHDSCFSR